MNHTVRSAFAHEFPLIRAIISHAFESSDEARLWDYLVAHDPGLTPDGVRVAVADGRPVACTVLLPRQVRTRRGLAPGAIVTLVACEPAYQNRGLGGATVRDAVACIKEQGLALGLLYGHPGYYSRFGFVSVLPSLGTILDVAAVPSVSPGLIPAGAGDLEALTTLYEQEAGAYLCAVARSPEPWLWQPRNPGHAVLTLPDRRGYAYVVTDQKPGILQVPEAAAAGPEAARTLLAGLCGAARECGLGKVRLTLPPGHSLVRLALLHGAEQIYRPAAAGMAVVTDWAQLLPPGYAVDGEGLLFQGRRVLRAGPEALTQLALGYHSGDDLLLLYDGDRMDLPAGFPRWSLAPFWS